MRGLRSNRVGLYLVAAAVFVFVPRLSAQSLRPETQPSAVTRDASKPAPALATESAARVGVSRVRTSATASAAAAAQPSDNTVKWAIIIGAAVLAALLIVALAD